MNIPITFERACLEAKERSEQHHCTQHVNVILKLEGSGARVVGYEVSDWSDGTTVKSYYDGTEL